MFDRLLNLELVTIFDDVKFIEHDEKIRAIIRLKNSTMTIITKFVDKNLRDLKTIIKETFEYRNKMNKKTTIFTLKHGILGKFNKINDKIILSPIHSKTRIYINPQQNNELFFLIRIIDKQTNNENLGKYKYIDENKEICVNYENFMHYHMCIVNESIKNMKLLLNNV